MGGFYGSDLEMVVSTSDFQTQDRSLDVSVRKAQEMWSVFLGRRKKYEARQSVPQTVRFSIQKAYSGGSVTAGLEWGLLRVGCCNSLDET